MSNEKCQGCKGTGTLTVTVGGVVVGSLSPCPFCRGTGTVAARAASDEGGQDG